MSTPSSSKRPFSGHRDLIVWQVSRKLVRDVYAASEGFPRHEVYGLTSQLRRAAVSVPANIAEGFGRRTRGEYIHHLSIARGSVREAETFTDLASNLGYLKQVVTDRLLEQLDHVGRLLTKLIDSLSPGSGRSTPATRDPRNTTRR